jgi:lipopolysaccharide transport system ATP-binding protein
VKNVSVGGGLIRSGDDVEFEVAYRSEKPSLRNVHMDLVIHGPFDEQLAQLSNTAQQGVFESIPGTGVFRCRVPRLPFEGGVYRITIYCEVDGDVADWVNNASTLNVEPGDYFGTGRTNNEAQGHFLIMHRWEVA